MLRSDRPTKSESKNHSSSFPSALQVENIIFSLFFSAQLSPFPAQHLLCANPTLSARAPPPLPSFLPPLSHRLPFCAFFNCVCLPSDNVGHEQCLFTHTYSPKQEKSYEGQPKQNRRHMHEVQLSSTPTSFFTPINFNGLLSVLLPHRHVLLYILFFNSKTRPSSITTLSVWVCHPLFLLLIV